MSGGSTTEVWEAAGVGHRITHEDDLPPPLGVVAQVIKPDLGGIASQDGQGPSLAAKISASLANQVQHELQIEGEPGGDCPDPCGQLELGSENTFVGPAQRPAAIADEEMDHDCNWHADGPVLTGARFVFVNGLPWARRNDELDCGARIGEGEPTVFIGGPPSETTEVQHPAAVLHPSGSLLGASKLATNAELAGKVGAALAGGGEAPEPVLADEIDGAQIGAAMSESKPKLAKVVHKISLSP
jgi:uncharacterized Zn-binding protein involved in type VI secretion